MCFQRYVSTADGQGSQRYYMQLSFTLGKGAKKNTEKSLIFSFSFFVGGSISKMYQNPQKIDYFEACCKQFISNTGIDIITSNNKGGPQ